MATRIFLAGAEVPRFAQCMVDMGCKSVLATYYGLRKDPDYVKRFKDKNPTVDLFTDSGAFTFFNKDKQPTVFYRNFKDRYVKWLEQNKGYVFAAAELDIDTLCPEAAQWRTDEFESLVRRGHNIVFVWHDAWQSQEDWTKYCQKYSYVGIGKGFQGADYNKYLTIARKYLTKVHAFGFTRSTEIQNYGFYSADSSTWLLGSKYGETDVFDVDHIYRYDNSKKSMRQRFRIKFQNAGLDWSLIEKEEYYEVIKMNMLAFIEMEAFLKKVNANKAYWNYKLPKPKKVLKFTANEVDAELQTKIGWSKELLAEVQLEDKQDRLYAFSLLQWNRLEAFKEWLKPITAEDALAVFGPDLTPMLVPYPDISPEAFDNVRTRFNMSMFKGKVALKRLAADLIPTKIPPKKREQELPDLEPVSDLSDTLMEGA